MHSVSVDVCISFPADGEEMAEIANIGLLQFIEDTVTLPSCGRVLAFRVNRDE